MDKSYDFDLFVIGAGSGGVRAARVAAALGARVAVSEMDRLGGTCVNVGCIPKKLLVYASEFSREVRDAVGFGWSAGLPSHSWQRLIANKDKEITRLNQLYGNLLETAGVTLLLGRAHLTDAHTICVGEQSYTAKNILLCPGGWPFVPIFPGSELAITSNEAFVLPELPKRVIIVGGGYIAVEFAGIFHGLGSQVTLLHRGDKLLRGFDEDLRDHLTIAMREDGIEVQFESEILQLERTPHGLIAQLNDGSTREVDQVMLATGRRPRSENLGLEALGIMLKPGGAVAVDAHSRTSVPHIFAVGDVTDRLNLTPVALAEGTAVAQTLFGKGPVEPDHACVPTAVFSQPNLGTVGVTEEQARAIYPEVDVYRSTFRPLKHTMSGRNERSLMKLIVDRQTDRVVGLHMLGDHAGEIVQGFAVAIKMGATKAQFDATVGIHPTAAEEFVTMRVKSQ